MRIWLAPSAFFPHRGGVEELTLKLAQHLQARGHDVLVVTNRHPLDLPAVDTVEHVAVRRLAFPAPGRHPARWAGYRRTSGTTRAQLEWLRPTPDVVHVVCASTQLPTIMRAARDRGVATVITTQGETEMDAGRLYQRSAWMRRALDRWSRQADVLTACSAWTAEVTANVAPAFAGAVVIPNGIDPADWAAVGSRPDEPVVAAWGRHVPQKGFDLLLSAFDLVRRQRPGARLLLGGDGPERPRLQAAAGPGVELVGPLDRSGVAALLSQARIAVVPSRVEPFGIVALEALAAGRGLVWSTRGGLAQASGGLGRGVDPHATVALADAMLAELADPTDPDAARVHAAAHDWSVLAAQYEQQYRAALQHRAARLSGRPEPPPR
jgi:glycosyltransferase involved in cell wall biosynthesis